VSAEIKPETKSVRFELDLPRGGFRKIGFFNVFRVEKEEGFRLLQVGLVTSLGVVDSFTCVITDFALETNRDSLVGFLKHLGPPQTTSPTPWKGVPVEKGLNIVDILHMAVSGRSAETTLFSFSVTTLMRVTKSASVDVELVPAEPLALLRCEPELQKHLIATLYE